MSMLCNQPTLIFGPPAPDRFSLRGIRFFAPKDDEGAGGGSGSDDDKSGEKGDDKGGGDKSGSGDGEKLYTKTELEAIVEKRLQRERRNASKSDDDKSGEKDGDKGEQPKALTPADVQKAIDDALAEKDKELAIERAGDALDKALEGRVYSASAVRKLDLEQFVNEDGKTVDTKKLNEWVEKNTTEGEKRSRRDPSQGQRSATSTAGSVQAGKDLFDNEKSKSKQKKE